jgi:hypothetical protein
MDKNEYLTQAQIKEALINDPIAISFRKRIVDIERILGEKYALRVQAEYEDYIKERYKDNPLST